MSWDAVTAIATVISMVAFVLTAVYIREQLRSLEKDRFLNITNELFTTWQSEEFMRAQLWLLHRMKETTWREFIENHRGDFGEIAFHRVGSFYDRVGTLVRMKLINQDEIFSTIGGHAIGVWQKIEPLVREARRIENSVLFDDFERILPACHVCYVPSLGEGERVNPFSIVQPEARRVSVDEASRKRDSGEPLAFLDVRHPSQVEADPETLPGAILIPADQVAARSGELDREREIIAFCA